MIEPMPASSKSHLPLVKADSISAAGVAPEITDTRGNKLLQRSELQAEKWEYVRERAMQTPK